MSVKQWTITEVESIRNEIREEVARQFLDDPQEAFKYLVNRLDDLPIGDQSVTKLMLILEILRMHARYQLLNKVEFKKLHEMARYMMMAKRVLGRSSRLSFLAAELTRVESELAGKNGELIRACWLAESSAAINDGDVSVHITRARALARLGQMNAAIDLLNSVATNAAQLKGEWAWELARCLRVAGRLDEAMAVAAEVNDFYPFPLWFELTSSVQKNQDYSHLLRMLRIMDSDGVDQLYAKAWLYAAGKRSLYDSLPTVESLRRKISKSELQPLGAFVDALKCLDEGYREGQSLQSRITIAGQALDHLDKQPTHEEVLLIYAGVLRFLLKFRQYSHARFILNEYDALCMKLTGSSTGDSLQILGDVNIDTISEKGLNRRSVTTAALMTLTKGAAVVTGTRLKALTASKTEAERLKQNEMERLSELMAEAFGSLKGGMMKVGQILSLMGEFSSEFKNPLRRLQFDAAPAPADEVEAVFGAEFGESPDSVFAEFESDPLAIGSVGQVHFGRLTDGKEVAIKIQHKDIEKSLRNDLRLLSLVRPIVKRLFPASNPSAIVEEIKTHLLLEVDYVREAEFQEKYRMHFQGDPDVIIPAVIGEFSREKVLTCEFLNATPFETFRKSASQEARNRAGRAIAKVFYQSVFELHLFNADPHPNNYLFMDDGRVVFLDFGCIKQFPPEFVEGLREITMSALENDAEKHFWAYVKLGYYKDTDPVDREASLRVGRVACEPLLYDREYKIDKAFVQKTADALVLSNNKFKRYLNPPMDGVLLVRFTFGLLSVLADLEATNNWHRIFRGLIENSPDKASSL